MLLRVVLVIPLCACLAGCPKHSLAAAKTDGGGLADAGMDAPTGSARAAASSAESSPRPKAPTVAKAPLSPAERKAVLAALGAGRKKSLAKDYEGALVAYDRALAIAPDDATVLAEVGWAALQSGDLARAEDANRRALLHALDPKLRAQILYNAGRVAEAKSDPAAARTAYAASLALRENAAVRRRLAAVSASKTGSGEASPSLPCAAGAATSKALCDCLMAKKDDLEAMTRLPGDAPTCTTVPASLGTPRLAVIRWGAASGGESRYLLAARDGSTLRPVADLGRDYEPGVFGVTDTATIEGGVTRTLGARTVHVVHSAQHDVDTNMAGLEACFHDVERETVCALAGAGGTTRCQTVDVKTTSGCGPGVVDPDLDPDTKAALDERKKDWGTKTSGRAWSLDADGALVVKEAGAGGKTVSKTPLFDR